jgi:hypothetical protein
MRVIIHTDSHEEPNRMDRRSWFFNLRLADIRAFSQDS